MVYPVWFLVLLRKYRTRPRRTLNLRFLNRPKALAKKVLKVLAFYLLVGLAIRLTAVPLIQLLLHQAGLN